MDKVIILEKLQENGNASMFLQIPVRSLRPHHRVLYDWKSSEEMIPQSL